MIKVGQIYETPEGNRWCVIREDDFGSPYAYVYLILPNGYVERLWKKTVKEELKLIAEYPTWQEAVNSKEFKNDSI